MLAFLRKYRDLLLVGLILFFSFAVFYANLKQERDLNLLDRVVLRVTAPAQRAVSALIEGTLNLWHDYVYLVDLRQENLRLQGEIARMREEYRRLEEAGQENIRLRQLMGFVEQHGGDPVPARVISVGTSAEFRTLRINRGKADGVLKGMPVVTHAGVAGRILQSFGGYADVLLIIDANSSIDVLARRSRARAVLQGRGEREQFDLEMVYLLRTEDVSVGDLVISSGMDGVFPKGLVVGKVKRIEEPRHGLYRKALVSPAVDFSRLEEVLVLSGGKS